MIRSWRQFLPFLLTLSALVAGFFSMVMSASGEFLEAARLIMLSMILDGLDGTLARHLKGTSHVGAELDTFVDLTSFGVAPALLAYEIFLKDLEVWGGLIAVAMVISGAYRLSRFKVVDPHRGQKGYLGLPITTAAGWVASFIIATKSELIDESWFALDHGPVAALFWTTTMVLIVLQVSHIRYAKPTKHPVIFIPFSLLMVFLFSHTRLAVAAALTLCAYGFIYAFISPFFHRQAVLVGEAEPEEEEESPVHHF